MPPCGGAPNFSASSRKPNRCLRLLLAHAQHAEHRGLHLRVVDTDAAAAALVAVDAPGRTPSPAPCRRVGSRRHARRSSSRGAVNGWWLAAQRFSSSSQMNNGKSTTQANLKSLLRRVVPASASLARCVAQRRRAPGRRRPPCRRRTAAGRPARAELLTAAPACAGGGKNFSIAESSLSALDLHPGQALRLARLTNSATRRPASARCC